MKKPTRLGAIASLSLIAAIAVDIAPRQSPASETIQAPSTSLAQAETAPTTDETVIRNLTEQWFAAWSPREARFTVKRFVLFMPKVTGKSWFLTTLMVVSSKLPALKITSKLGSP